VARGLGMAGAASLVAIDPLLGLRTVRDG